MNIADGRDWIAEFLKRINSHSNKDLRVEEGLSIKNKHIPEKLFKYRAISENVNECRELKNLENGTLWFTFPENFNDPYDSSFTVSLYDAAMKGPLKNLDKLNLPQKTLDELKKHPAPLKYLYEEAAVRHGLEKASKAQALFREEINSISRLIPETLRNTMEMCCFFAGKNTSILMWSHYANNHKGFCIEYDFKSLPDDDLRKRFLYPVFYSNDLFDLTKYFDVRAIGGVENFNNLSVLLPCLYKSTEWEYEKEWRIIFLPSLTARAGCKFMPTPSHVYLGARIGNEEKRAVLEICQRKNIPCSQFKLSDTEFKLLPQAL